jgi:hypothetical protein
MGIVKIAANRQTVNSLFVIKQTYLKFLTFRLNFLIHQLVIIPTLQPQTSTYEENSDCTYPGF